MTDYQQRAEDCLRCLFLGLHPKTQEVLTDPGVLADPDVLRSLSLALKALENRHTPARERSTRHVRQGEPWNKEEDRTLSQDFASGATLSQIVRQLGRSPEGIYARLVRLGLASSRNQAQAFVGACRTQSGTGSYKAK